MIFFFSLKVTLTFLTLKRVKLLSIVNYEFTLIVCLFVCFFLTSIGSSAVSSQGCLIFLIIVHPTVKSETIPVTVIPEVMPVFGVIFPESWEKRCLLQLP